MKHVPASEIVEALERQGLTRGGLQALLGAATASGEVELEHALEAMRALLIIVEAADVD
jgi:hypothetical protein